MTYKVNSLFPYSVEIPRYGKSEFTLTDFGKLRSFFGKLRSLDN
jgi:hypothetical protein